MSESKKYNAEQKKKKRHKKEYIKTFIHIKTHQQAKLYFSGIRT